MTDLKKVIPLDFHNSKGSPVIVGTVGEAIERLKQLPKDLPIVGSAWIADGVGARMFVYNIDTDNPHLCFDEVD